MSDHWKQFGRAAISGADRSWPAAAARAVAAAAEPGYATAMWVRNRLYDIGLKRTHDLGRPAVSVGNITTGGTGKTPMVAWLAQHLREAGRRPAVLLRGYGAAVASDSDERRLLAAELGDGIPVRANPSRVAAAAALLADRPGVDLILLDDAFQHRRAARAVDLVLISATDPFGYGRVLPRGLLREPRSGLGRADALLLTRCNGVPADRLDHIESELRRFNPAAPIYRADYVHSGLWDPNTGQTMPVGRLAHEPFFAVAGVGDPDALAAQLRAYGDHFQGHRWFADHHRYTAADVAEVHAVAGNTRIVTTDKDWVKLAQLPGTDAWLVGVLRLAVHFHADHGAALLRHILASPGAGRASPTGD